MTPTMTTLAKTIVGKATLGVAILTMGVGAAVASGAEIPVPNPDEGSEQVAPADAGSIDELSPVEVPEWKGIKAKGRAGWHALRDERRTEWLSAKAAFVAQCGDDDATESTEADETEADETEADDQGAGSEDSTEMSAECQALKAELKALKDAGKTEWKTARDQAKAEWKAAKDEAKTEALAARDDAKAERSAARDEAKVERSAARQDKKDKSGKPGK